MKSYLSDSSQHILIAASSSADSQLDFGVPQGSVLGSTHLERSSNDMILNVTLMLMI